MDKEQSLELLMLLSAVESWSFAKKRTARRTVMDIKEIAKRIRKTNNSYMLSMSPDIAAEFAESLIEAYKAELLKEVGEPVGLVTFVDGECYAELSDTAKLVEFDELFTSDQLATAILKATGALEKEIERLKTVPMKYRRMAFNAQLQDENNELRTQLAAAQEEMNGWRNQAHQSQSAFDRLQDQLAKAEQLWQVAQGRCDGLEEKLAKAEQRVAEWQPISTAPKDGTVIMVAEETEPGFWEYEQGFYSHTWGFGGGSCTNNPTHWMPLPKAPNGASS